MPYQIGTSKCSRPASAAVGVFGITTERCADNTAIARARPAWIWLAAAGTAMISISTSPPIMPTKAWPDPLYGTCTILIPARLCKSSGARCVVVPMPPEPNVNLPGLRRASEISSFNVFAGTDGWTSNTFWITAICAIGARSLAGS